MNALAAGGSGKGAKGADAAASSAPKLSVNDFVIKAAAKALRDVPGGRMHGQRRCNRCWHRCGLRWWDRYHCQVGGCWCW